MSQIPRVKSRKILKEKNDENDRSRVWRAREGTEKREREKGKAAELERRIQAERTNINMISHKNKSHATQI